MLIEDYYLQPQSNITSKVE